MSDQAAEDMQRSQQQVGGMRSTSSPGNVPIPDPSTLTTEQLRRELAALREIIEARLDGSDKATELRLVATEAIPARIKEEITHLDALLTARMNTLDETLQLRILAVQDVGTEHFAAIDGTFGSNALALAAALAAQKEAAAETNKANALAIGKSEEATKERLQALETLMNTGLASLRDAQTGVTSRLDRGEGTTTGKDDSALRLIAVLGVILALLGVMIAGAAAVKAFAG